MTSEDFNRKLSNVYTSDSIVSACTSEFCVLVVNKPNHSIHTPVYKSQP
jgi:hypothetical protein